MMFTQKDSVFVAPGFSPAPPGSCDAQDSVKVAAAAHFRGLQRVTCEGTPYPRFAAVGVRAPFQPYGTLTDSDGFTGPAWLMGLGTAAPMKAGGKGFQIADLRFKAGRGCTGQDAQDWKLQI